MSHSQYEKVRLLPWPDLSVAVVQRLARSIFGVDSYESGSVKVNNKPLKKNSPIAAMAEKIALVPEDRRQQGLFMVAGVNRNISMESFDRLKGKIFLNFKKERALTNEWKENLSIKYADQSDPVDRLSGGNQQKTVLAKWLATDPDFTHSRRTNSWNRCWY